MSLNVSGFMGITPLLSVFDMPEALAFYQGLLGFELVSASPAIETPEGKFSHWMWLRLGNANLMLNTKYDAGERPLHRMEADSAVHRDTCLYVGCTDVDAAYQQLAERGLKVDPPTTAPYGLRLFSARDPDGYLVVFQEAT